MRACSLPLFVAFLAAVAPPAPSLASDTATGQIVVTAQFGARTALKVSSTLLEFDVTAPGEPATASVDFSAAARTALGGEVVLSIEPARALEGPGGAADVDASISFSGIGEGTTTGTFAPARPAVAGRWVGSGIRTGRLVFALRAAASGSYTLPVRFVLSAP